MRRRGNLKEYIASLEKEFSLIENGFKEEEKRALTDYKANDNEYAKTPQKALQSVLRISFKTNTIIPKW